jgi:hypothetical protein
MKRRGFVKLCASALAGITASPELLARENQVYHRYGRVALIDSYSGEPVRAASLDVGEAYLFHYPYVSTPCFLIDLGKAVTSHSNLKTRDGDRYRWQGGAGKNESVVAFSAICAHKMTHPAPSVSFINYRHKEVKFRNNNDEIEQRAGVIYCCSENTRHMGVGYWVVPRRSHSRRSNLNTIKNKIHFLLPPPLAARCSIVISKTFMTGWYCSMVVSTSIAR